VSNNSSSFLTRRSAGSPIGFTERWCQQVGTQLRALTTNDALAIFLDSRAMRALG
jgi:hypothetical protein